MKRKQSVRYIVIYTGIVLVLANVCWYIGYSDPEAEYAAFLVVIASFLPMAVTLIMTKITGEGWNHLGIQFQLKKNWRIYLLAVGGTVLLTYFADPFMLMLFPGKVSSSFTMAGLPGILGDVLLGTACLIECLGEELGWISYLFTKLENVMGTLPACLLLGIIRGIYHLGILVWMEFPAAMFVEITLSNMCLQPFLAYMYKKSGSVFPCSISHGISNLLPIFLVYESQWYYTNIRAMAVCMLPAVLFGICGSIGLRRMELKNAEKISPATIG